MSVVRKGRTELQRISEDPKSRAYFESASLQLVFSVLIHDAFKAAGITRVELAKRMGVSRARVSQILNGYPQNLTLDLAGRVVGALGLRWRVVLRDYWTNHELFSVADSPIEPERASRGGGGEGGA